MLGQQVSVSTFDRPGRLTTLLSGISRSDLSRKENPIRWKIASGLSGVVVSIVMVGTCLAGDPIESGIKVGEAATFKVESEVDGEAAYRLTEDGSKTVKEGKLKLEKGKATELTGALDKPGFLQLRVSLGKDEALAAFASQQAVRDYAGAIQGLNAYRRLTLSGRGPVEAFRVVTFEEASTTSFGPRSSSYRQ